MATSDATRHTTNVATARDTVATRDTTKPVLSRHFVALPEAARRLGVSLRTVQRRVEKGVLRSIERDGKRFVALEPSELWDAAEARHDATNVACRDTTEPVLSRHATRQSATNVAPTAAPPGASGDDFTAHLIEENRFLRGVVEQLQRDAAEVRAALRKALELAPKELPAPAEAKTGETPTEEIPNKIKQEKSRQKSAKNTTLVTSYADVLAELGEL